MTEGFKTYVANLLDELFGQIVLPEGYEPTQRTRIYTQVKERAYMRMHRYIRRQKVEPKVREEMRVYAMKAAEMKVHSMYVTIVKKNPRYK